MKGWLYMKYDIIYSDPPWPQKKGNLRKSRPNQGKELDYSTMSVKDCFVTQDQFLDAAAEKHNVFMWTIDKFLHDTEAEMAKRGYKLHARFVWDKVSDRFIKGGNYDLSCIGIRQSEGGIRSATYKNCFSEDKDIDRFRPVFWLRDNDIAKYCEYYGVTHSKCYTQYGLVRTGCFGCPFGKRFEEELRTIELHEPKLLRAANGIFGESYDYTRRYLVFREEMKLRKKSRTIGGEFNNENEYKEN